MTQPVDPQETSTIATGKSQPQHLPLDFCTVFCRDQQVCLQYKPLLNSGCELYSTLQYGSKFVPGPMLRIAAYRSRLLDLRAHSTRQRQRCPKRCQSYIETSVYQVRAGLSSASLKTN